MAEANVFSHRSLPYICLPCDAFAVPWLSRKTFPGGNYTNLLRDPRYIGRRRRTMMKSNDIHPIENRCARSNNIVPVTLTVSVITRHSAKCPNHSDPKWENCNCRKSLYIYQGGKAR